MHIDLHHSARDLRPTRFVATSLLVGVLAAGSACGRSADSSEPQATSARTSALPPSSTEPTSPAMAAQAAASPASGSSATYGEKITAPLVSLAEIAAHPSRFQNEVVATSGKVTAVCQERGCWMEMADASGRAHIRMHGHSFFVPRTAPGHTARVQARLVPARAGGMDCESDGKDPNGVARVELDATGVELD